MFLFGTHPEKMLKHALAVNLSAPYTCGHSMATQEKDTHTHPERQTHTPKEEEGEEAEEKEERTGVLSATREREHRPAHPSSYPQLFHSAEPGVQPQALVRGNRSQREKNTHHTHPQHTQHTRKNTFIVKGNIFKCLHPNV